MVGTLIYMAPEILTKKIHTEKSDVYSFGVSINELITGVVPYTDLRAEAQAHTVLEMNYTEQQLTAAVVSGGLRPVLAGPELGAPSSLLSLIQRCWDANPQSRPSFNDIVAELDLILEHRKTAKDMTPDKPAGSRDDHLMDNINSLQTYQESINWSTQGEHFSRIAYRDTESSLRVWLDNSNDPLAYYPVLSWGSFASCGRRETMEDTHFLMPHMCNEKDIHVFGIFDGHRGAAAAEFSARALPGFLQSFGSTSSPSKALLEAFVKTDVAFRDELDSYRKSKRGTQKDWHPGCTAVAALIVRSKLFVANAGDCRTVLCRAGHPIVLTKDHVASCFEERERVLNAGGQVKWQVDTWRVGPAALQVTRSIGDDDLKPAVTAEPEITETDLSGEDEFLVMASDGLWDVVSNSDVINIIRDTVKEPGMCAKRLATEAAERGSKDNITVASHRHSPASFGDRDRHIVWLSENQSSSSSMAAAPAYATAYSNTAILVPRLHTTKPTVRCSALPYLPPRFSSTAFTASTKNFSESRRSSLLQVRASSSEDTSINTSELFTDLKEKWDAVENKSTVLLYGGGAIVAVWLSSVVVGAVNSVPLLPKIMELVGLGYTGWFVYRYLLFKSSRKELATDIEALKKKIDGTE